MNFLINKWLRKRILLNKFTFSVCFSTQESSTITSLYLNFYLKTGNYLTFFNDHTGKFHSTKLLSKNKFYLSSKSFTVTVMAQIVLEFIFSLTNNKSYFFFEKCLLFVQTNIEFLVDVVPDDELEFECSVSRLSVVEELRILDFGLISSKLTPLVSGTNAKLNKKPKAAIMA